MSKRKTSSDTGLKSKKRKGNKDDEEEDAFTSKTTFCEVCQQARLKLKNGHKYNELATEQAVFQRKVQKELRLNPEMIDRFVESFEDYIEEPNRFHKSLMPCVTLPGSEGAREGFQNSLVKSLLGINVVQTAVMNKLIEQLPLFSGDGDCIIEKGQKVNIPHLLLSQFQWLDTIVNSKEVTEKLLEMVGISCDDVQREIIACLPNIIQDCQHEEVAASLRDIMMENRQLMVSVLDALSNLILTPQLLTEIRESVLQSVKSIDLEHLPVLVKFLLQSTTNQDALEVISELRANLDFDSTTTQASTSKRKSHVSSSESTETLILETISSAVRFQKHVGDAFIKAIETVSEAGSHKVVDMFILLILHNTSRRKAVESVFRNKIRSGCFAEAYLKSVYGVHSQVLKSYFPAILNLSEVLLRSPEPPVSYFGCSLYKHSFLAFDMYHQQEIVGNLIGHVGSGCEMEMDAAMDILDHLINQHLAKMIPFAILMKSMLDYLDNLSVCQMRKLYYMLSALEFKNPQGGGLIQDDLHIVIRKQLSNNNLKYKRMGVIGAVTIVSCIAQSSGDDQGDSVQEEMSTELFKQVTSLLQLVRTSSSKSPEAYALFMDELSSIISHAHLCPKVEEWIQEHLASDFQESFVVDVEPDVQKECGNFKVDLQYGLDDAADVTDDIAVNLAPLVVNKYNKRTALDVYMNQGMSDPVCLAPCLRLLRVCEMQKFGNLENIDALLGCPLYLINEDVYSKVEPLSPREKEVLIATLFFCINWCIEIVNGFSGQSDVEVKGKVIMRLQNITHFQKLLLNCLTALPSVKPPPANFDQEDVAAPAVNVAGSSKGETKKRVKKKKGSNKENVGSDSDDNSRDSTQMNNTTVVSQAADVTENREREKPTTSLSAYKPFFRELDISVFTILETQSITRSSLDSDMNTKGETELSLEPAQVEFLLQDLCRKLSHALLAASSAKRKTFFKVKGEKRVGFCNLDQLSPLQVARNGIKLSPALCNHLESTSGFFQTLIAQNDGVLDGPGSHSEDALMIGSCFQLLLQALLAIFSWNGFEMIENRGLLKEGLAVLVRRMNPSASSQLALLDLVKSSMQYLGNYSSTVPDIGTAVTLLKLMISLAEKTDDKSVNLKLAQIADEFLKREWMAPDGQREKGAKFNEQLQTVIKSYIIYSEDPLTAIEEIATKAMPELLQADKNGCSDTYPTLSRPSYAVFYRVIFSELIVVVKTIPACKQTESFDVWMDRLLRWNIAVRILQILVNLVKAFDGRSNLGTCIKYGRFFIDLFLRLGMPLLDKMFRKHRADIHGLLKNLQLSTRALHHMCGHSKIIKDVALTNQVPMLKRSLEGFVFRVKAMLTVNKCLEAFWIGNLKNRDIQGEEILSQSSVVERSQTDVDSDAETLPDDDDLSDVELDNDSNNGNETRDVDVTDPEGSLSQMF